MQHPVRNTALFLILLLLLLVSGIYIYLALGPKKDAGQPAATGAGFSPFNRGDVSSAGAATDTTYADFSGGAAPRPAAIAPAYSGSAPAYAPTTVQSSQTPTYQSPTYAPQQTSSQPTQTFQSPTYAPSAAIDTNAPYFQNYYVQPTGYVNSAPTATSTPTKSTGSGSNSGGSSTNIPQTIFGYASGLYELDDIFGSTIGKTAADTAFMFTPEGSTGATLGQVVPGGSSITGTGGSGGGGGLGGIGGGGFGGGGGGSGIGGGNFGGKVTQVTYCTCEASIMLNINDVRGSQTQLIYMPGVSQLYANYNVYGTGQEVLGTYTQGGSCLVYVGESCETQGNPSGTIKLIGTSAGAGQ